MRILLKLKLIFIYYLFAICSFSQSSQICVGRINFYTYAPETDLYLANTPYIIKTDPKGYFNIYSDYFNLEEKDTLLLIIKPIGYRNIFTTLEYNKLFEPLSNNLSFTLNPEYINGNYELILSGTISLKGAILSNKKYIIEIGTDYYDKIVQVQDGKFECSFDGLSNINDIWVYCRCNGFEPIAKKLLLDPPINYKYNINNLEFELNKINEYLNIKLDVYSSINNRKLNDFVIIGGDNELKRLDNSENIFLVDNIKPNRVLPLKVNCPQHLSYKFNAILPNKHIKNLGKIFLTPTIKTINFNFYDELKRRIKPDSILINDRKMTIEDKKIYYQVVDNIINEDIVETYFSKLFNEEYLSFSYTESDTIYGDILTYKSYELDINFFDDDWKPRYVDLTNLTLQSEDRVLYKSIPGQLQSTKFNFKTFGSQKINLILNFSDNTKIVEELDLLKLLRKNKLIFNFQIANKSFLNISEWPDKFNLYIKDSKGLKHDFLTSKSKLIEIRSGFTEIKFLNIYFNRYDTTYNLAPYDTVLIPFKAKQKKANILLDINTEFINKDSVTIVFKPVDIFNVLKIKNDTINTLTNQITHIDSINSGEYIFLINSSQYVPYLDTIRIINDSSYTISVVNKKIPLFIKFPLNKKYYFSLEQINLKNISKKIEENSNDDGIFEIDTLKVGTYKIEFSRRKKSGEFYQSKIDTFRLNWSKDIREAKYIMDKNLDFEATNFSIICDPYFGNDPVNLLKNIFSKIGFGQSNTLIKLTDKYLSQKRNNIQQDILVTYNDIFMLKIGHISNLNLAIKGWDYYLEETSFEFLFSNKYILHNNLLLSYNILYPWIAERKKYITEGWINHILSIMYYKNYRFDIHSSSNISSMSTFCSRLFYQYNKYDIADNINQNSYFTFSNTLSIPFLINKLFVGSSIKINISTKNHIIWMNNNLWLSTFFNNGLYCYIDYLPLLINIENAPIIDYKKSIKFKIGLGFIRQ